MLRLAVEKRGFNLVLAFIFDGLLGWWCNLRPVSFPYWSSFPVQNFHDQAPSLLKMLGFYWIPFIPLNLVLWLLLSVAHYTLIMVPLKERVNEFEILQTLLKEKMNLFTCWYCCNLLDIYM